MENGVPDLTIKQAELFLHQSFSFRLRDGTTQIHQRDVLSGPLALQNCSSAMTVGSTVRLGLAIKNQFASRVDLIYPEALT